MTSKSAAESSQRVLRRKREILREASRAFAERGFHRTGMREIAAALGRSAGNLYYYFSSKEELLAFCQEETAGWLLELVGWVQQQVRSRRVR